MDLIWEKFTEWLKEILVGGIMDNLSGLFDNVNAKVADISGQVGATPQGWNGGIYNMIYDIQNGVDRDLAAAAEPAVLAAPAEGKEADHENN